MAKGESRWDPKAREVHKQEFRLAPTNDYTIKSKANFRVQCKDEPGAIPYVWGNAELLDTSEEGGKNISMLLPFYLTLTPRKEDGKPAVDLSGGLTELCQLLNVEVPQEVMDGIIKFGATDERGEVEALNAKLVKDFLNNLGEFTVRTHVKLQPARAPWPAKNQIDYFIVDEVNRVG